MKRTHWIMAGLAVLVCFLAASTLSYGFDEKQLKTLKASNACKKCDLSGANLSGANLTSTILQSANLSGANLSGANCTGANFNEANLKGANVTKANFAKAYFDQARWTDGKMCSIGSLGQCK